MEKKFEFDPAKLSKYVGVVVSILLVIFDVVICVQYATVKYDVWLLVTLVVSCFVLDVLCLVEILKVKTLKAHIALYILDFLLLLVISTIAGSTYLSALYCVILSLFYSNVDDFRSKLAVFIASCVAYVATFAVGWVIIHTGVSADVAAIEILSGCILGLVIILAHFVVANFLLHYARTNMRLTAALKEADENKSKLKEAYEQLSETAMFEERNRIARDIHDNAGHSMTAVIMQTEAAKVLIDTNPEEAKARIISANIQAKNALEQMRDSVHLLAGREGERRVKEELEEIIAQTMDGTDVKVRSDIDDAEVSIYGRRFLANSLKECFANGLRHGKATAFYVELKANRGEVTLIVSDNGTGLSEDFKEGYGIRGMRDSAAALGGSIRYESEDGEGFEMYIRLPEDKGKEETKND